MTMSDRQIWWATTVLAAITLAVVLFSAATGRL